MTGRARGEPGAPPDVHITVHRLFGEPRDFTLSYPLDPEHHEMLGTIHREFGGRRGRDGQVIEDRMHPRLPRATPGVPGGWLTIASIRDPHSGPNARKWRLGHWPGSNLPGHHDVPSRMSASHLEGQEYVASRINEHGGGFRGATEKSVARGTRSDVVAFDRHGKPAATFEIQYAGQSDGLAVRRDRAVERAGIPGSWLGPTDSRPPWASKVAWLGANRREGMARGSWRVTSGRSAIEMEPCRPGSRQDCHFGRGWCGGEHPLWWPRHGTVDDIVDGIIAGELRRFNNGKRIVIATPADCQRWVDHCRTPKVARRAEQASRRRAATNSINHNGSYPEAKIMASMRARASSQQVPVCTVCAEEKWSAVAAGICLDCRLDASAAPHRVADHATPAFVDLPSLCPAPPQTEPEPHRSWALGTAQRAAIDLTPAMRSYAELLILWRLAQRNGTATPELLEACRKRKAEIIGGEV